MGIFRNQIFDPFHTMYIVGSLGITVLLLYIFKKFAKDEKSKDNILLFFSLLTFLIHLSPLWAQFLNHKDPIAVDNMLFPIYFCNLAMLMLLVTALKRDRNSKSFKFLSISTAYSGTIGALISLIYPDYYLSVSGGMTFGILKSMISHSTMLVGSLYLFVGKYVEVKHENTKYFIYGLLFYGFIGLIVNVTFVSFGLPNPNSMYLVGSAIEEVKFLNGYFIGPVLILVTYTFNEMYIKLIEHNHKSIKLRPKH